MAIIPILQYPDPRLHQKARQVSDPLAQDIQKIIADMLETLAHTEQCAALAATQLDIPNPPAITVINPIGAITEPLCLINPEIVTSEGEQAEPEGCMSVYPQEVYAIVKRAQKIKLKALDRNGQPLEITAEDFLAKCFQHEIDHLNGILFVDRLSSLKRQRLEKKIANLKITS
jgi:peptide deformylase